MGSTELRGFLLDTHLWFWYLTGSKRLPYSLKEIIDHSPDECWISPISVWEIGMHVKRQRIKIKGKYRQWVNKALKSFPVREAPLNNEVSLVSEEIKLPHRDPADHFIAATSIVYELTLLTVDEKLLGYNWLKSRSG